MPAGSHRHTELSLAAPTVILGPVAEILGQPWCFVMKSAGEYRAYAEQCIESAKTAHSQEARDALLEMARVWIDAAHQLEGFGLLKGRPSASLDKFERC